MMHYLKTSLTLLLTGIALTLNSCASSLANPKSSALPNSEITDASLTTPLDSNLASSGKKTPQIPVASQLETIKINLYQIDNQCQGLVQKKVAISANNPLDQTVAKILNQTDSADFNLAGYRVKVEPKHKIATIDLRLPPQSKRKFTSLSNCEQLALFGSLRKTLTSNPKLNIKDVRFTNQGTLITY